MKLATLLPSLGLAQRLYVSYSANVHLQLCKARCDTPEEMALCFGKCEEQHNGRVEGCSRGYAEPIDTLPMCSDHPDSGHAAIPTATQMAQLADCQRSCPEATSHVCALTCELEMEKAMRNCKDHTLPPGVCTRLPREPNPRPTGDATKPSEDEGRVKAADPPSRQNDKTKAPTRSTKPAGSKDEAKGKHKPRRKEKPAEQSPKRPTRTTHVADMHPKAKQPGPRKKTDPATTTEKPTEESSRRKRATNEEPAKRPNKSQARERPDETALLSENTLLLDVIQQEPDPETQEKSTSRAECPGPWAGWLLLPLAAFLI